MRAALCERYGPPEVVKIAERPTPIPGDGEVLIRAAATTVNSGDARVRALRVPRGLGPVVRLQFGIRGLRQSILGLDTAGEVEAVGRAVKRFKPGNRVVASRDFRFGCHAEYVTVAEDGAIATLPEGVGYQEAVALGFGGSTALDFLERGKLAAGERIAINGASGAVGVMAVQLAKRTGAEVTAICSGANADLVRSLGADHVISYAEEDFTRNGERYDVIMDAHGSAPYSRLRDSLAPGGRFLMVVGGLGQMLAATRQRATVGGTSHFTAESYRALLSLAERGALKPVFDSVLPFDEIVEAHRRVDTGHKVGSLVLTFGGGS